MKTLAFSSTKKDVPTEQESTSQVRSTDDGLMFFSSCNIRAFYTRENKPRLTLATVYKIRERKYLYEYIFPGQYKPRLEKDMNVDFVPFIRDEHSSLL